MNCISFICITWSVLNLQISLYDHKYHYMIIIYQASKQMTFYYIFAHLVIHRIQCNII